MKKLSIILFIFNLIILLSCQKDEELEPTINVTSKPAPYTDNLNGDLINSTIKPSYLDVWFGEYEGTSHHWSSYPTGTGMCYNNYYKKVNVVVNKGSIDSTLNLNITYDDTIFSPHLNIKFSTIGQYLFSSGGGSSYGSKNIRFLNDSLSYNYFQKCGIPCSSGIDFKIKKK